MADKDASGEATEKAVAGDHHDRPFASERLGKIPIKPKIGTAIIADLRGQPVAIDYIHVGEYAVFEGDIVLGTVEEVERHTNAARESGPPLVHLITSHDASALNLMANDDAMAFSVAMASAILPTGPNGQQYRWPNGTVPWEIAPDFYDKSRVLGAIAHWREKTWLQFPERTTEQNWVYFANGQGCSSRVGMQGGRQFIQLGRECTTGNVIHEIAHTVGLWHEQSRKDRDRYVKINYQNIVSGMEGQFSQHVTDGDDIGAYDYDSIMHYPRFAFTRNQQETITPLQPGVSIGQREALSAGDIAAIRKMYPAVFRHFDDDSGDGGVIAPPQPPVSPGPASIAEELQIQLLQIDADLSAEQAKAAQSALAIARLQSTRDDISEAYQRAVAAVQGADR